MALFLNYFVNFEGDFLLPDLQKLVKKSWSGSANQNVAALISERKIIESKSLN